MDCLLALISMVIMICGS